MNRYSGPKLRNALNLTGFPAHFSSHAGNSGVDRLLDGRKRGRRFQLQNFSTTQHFLVNVSPSQFKIESSLVFAEFRFAQWKSRLKILIIITVSGTERADPTQGLFWYKTIC